MIKIYTDLMWNKVRPLILVQGSFYLLFTILTSLHILLLDDNSAIESGFNATCVYILSGFTFIAILSSIFEFFKEGRRYLDDWWNISDVSLEVFLATYLITSLTEADQSHQPLFLGLSVFFIWIRTLGFLRLFLQLR